MSENKLFEIRRAKPEDAEAIREITREAFTKYCEVVGISDIAALHESVDDVRRDIENKTVLAAYVGSAAAGSLRLSFDASSKAAYLSRFGVSGEYRSSGIGSALVRAADEEALTRGMEHMRLHTAGNAAELMKLYFSLGFRVESSSFTGEYTRVCMVRDYI